VIYVLTTAQVNTPPQNVEKEKRKGRKEKTKLKKVEWKVQERCDDEKKQEGEEVL
jgi:hypothetical protein